MGTLPRRVARENRGASIRPGDGVPAGNRHTCNALQTSASTSRRFRIEGSRAFALCGGNTDFQMRKSGEGTYVQETPDPFGGAPGVLGRARPPCSRAVAALFARCWPLLSRFFAASFTPACRVESWCRVPFLRRHGRWGVHPYSRTLLDAEAETDRFNESRFDAARNRAETAVKEASNNGRTTVVFRRNPRFRPSASASLLENSPLFSSVPSANPARAAGSHQR